MGDMDMSDDKIKSNGDTTNTAADSNNPPQFCSFCGKAVYEVKKLVSGRNVCICDECINLCNDIMADDLRAEVGRDTAKLPTPRQIYDFLNEYIVGQDNAKRTLSVAVYNHYKRHSVALNTNVEIQKSNVLLIGPTGTGKTLFAQTLARILDVPFAIADATTLTEAGYVGDDVESVLTRLLQNELVEGTVANVPAGGAGRKHPGEATVQLDTSKILFICGGAFDGLNKIIGARTNERAGIGFGATVQSKQERESKNYLADVQPQDLVKFGIIPELVGRLPIVTTLQDLDEDALVKILTEPKNAIVKQYAAMLEMDGVKLTITDDGLRAIARRAVERKTGARGLRSILENILLEPMFAAPDKPDLAEIVIDHDVVDGKKPPVEILRDAKKVA